MIHFLFVTLKIKSRLVAGIRKDLGASCEPFTCQSLFVFKEVQHVKRQK